MTVFSLTNSNNQRDAATATTNWTSEGGGGAGPGVEPDFIYSGGISRKVGTTLGGFKMVDPTTVDMTAAADNTVMMKAIWTNASALLTTPPTATLWVGSDTSNYNRYDIHTQASYPPKGGWIITPINPNLAAWVDVITGTPSLTAIDTYVYRGDFSTSAKAENLVASAVDISPGLYLTGGTSTDPRATWDAFVQYDELGGSPQRIGHCSSLEGIANALKCYGTFAIGQTASGTSTATGFEDTGAILFFPGGLVDAGWNRILIDIATAGDDYSNTRMVATGLGRQGQKLFFSVRNESATDGNINPTADTIEMPTSQKDGWENEYFDGLAVLYSKEGGTASTGLTDNTVYFVGNFETVGTATFTLHTTRAAAVAGTGAVNLSAVNVGENHSLTITPDTRPDYTVTGTVDTATETGSVFNDFRNFTLTSAASLIDCILNNPQQVDIGSGTMSGCIVNGSTQELGVGIVTGTSLTNFSDNTIIASIRNTGQGGHAFEFTGTAATFDWSNDAQGFGPDLIEFHTTDDVDGVNDRIDWTAHGYATGDAVYYQDQGGVVSMGLTDGQLYYVNAFSANSFSLHDTQRKAINGSNPINLTSTGAETHEIASANAAVFNNTSSGTLTLNVTGGGTAPSVRNADGATTVVNAGVTITVTVTDEDGVAVEGARVRVERTSDGSLVIEGTTNASGVFSDSSFVYTADVAVRTKVRLKGFKPFRTLGTIESTGLSVGVTFISDNIVDLP